MLPHRWLLENDGTYVCYDCEHKVSKLSGDVNVEVKNAYKGTSVVVVTEISSAASLGTILLEIEAPNGFVLRNVEFSDEDMTFVGADAVSGVYPNPYTVTALNVAGATGAVSGKITLTYECAEELDGAILVSSSECYDLDLNPLAVNAVGGKVIDRPEGVIEGDADEDGFVTLKDVLCILHAIFEGEFIANGDMNNDGKMTLADALRTLQNIAM